MAGAILWIACRDNVAGFCNVTHKIVVMGVSGSGKSTLARELAVALEGVFIEGDEHHSAESRDKMCRGIALCDSDREPWLDRLAEQVDDMHGTAVLSCSALRRRYRERMRARVAGLRFVFLDITLSAAVARVSGRPDHEFPATLVADQFATLESPVGEDGVLHLSALQDSACSLREVVRWLGESDSAGWKSDELESKRS
ncbi:carbohydrate kinase, thermoresistant glucokinase family [Burkholderia sp. OK233]|nr:carbohydrate kinase, thermoresistant glucokinase family [Burkholderia sp. OK233]